MTIPYLAHLPFVAVFLLFTIVFAVTHWSVRRR